MKALLILDFDDDARLFFRSFFGFEVLMDAELLTWLRTSMEEPAEPEPLKPAADKAPSEPRSNNKLKLIRTQTFLKVFFLHSPEYADCSERSPPPPPLSPWWFRLEDEDPTDFPLDLVLGVSSGVCSISLNASRFDLTVMLRWQTDFKISNARTCFVTCSKLWPFTSRIWSPRFKPISSA